MLWIRELAKVTWVAVCSGNHDNAGRHISADRAPVYEWLAALGREPKVITDGATQTVNDLIVTTVPYHFSKEQKSVLLDRGFTIRRQRGNQWLVLHHVPPSTYTGSGEGCNAGLFREALQEVYIPRIQRENASFAANVLGTRGALLSVLIHFFEHGRLGITRGEGRRRAESNCRSSALHSHAGRAISNGHSRTGKPGGAHLLRARRALMSFA
jgi:hypothetical protein